MHQLKYQNPNGYSIAEFPPTGLFATPPIAHQAARLYVRLAAGFTINWSMTRRTPASPVIAFKAADF
jgi:hypothetical protein